MEPIKIGNTMLYNGNCLDIFPTLPRIDAVVTDPPYGAGLSGDYHTRFKNKAGNWWKNSDRSEQTRHEKISGDEEPFDPQPLLDLKAQEYVLWGANWYSSRLPDSGGWWIWDKRKGVENADWPMSEAELAWTNIGKGTRFFRHKWFGLLRDSEKGENYHPTQKPVALMEWCISRLKSDGIIFDPYMGSGPVGVASVNMGRPYIGIEIEKKYFDIACERIKAAYSQHRLFA